jgi:hypothetical protein
METTQKSTRYRHLIAQLKDLFTVTTDPVSRMAILDSFLPPLYILTEHVLSRIKKAGISPAVQAIL